MDIENIENLAEEVKNWDREDIKVLKEKFKELEAAINIYNNESGLVDEISFEDYINISSLPTAQMNKLGPHTDYPIWAVDKNRQALVGLGLDRIESEEEILEHYEA